MVLFNLLLNLCGGCDHGSDRRGRHGSCFRCCCSSSFEMKESSNRSLMNLKFEDPLVTLMVLVRAALAA